MGFTRIEDADLNNVGVIGLPDRPGLSTAAMQNKLEETSRSVVIPKHNGLIDELEDVTAAENIGITPPTGRTGTKIKAVIDELSSAVDGSVKDTFKNIESGGTTYTASGEDTFKINAGSNVTITPLVGDKGISISATGGGQSTGDMLMSDYDSSGDVKSASSTGNGIKDYVASAISGKQDTLSHGTGISISSNTVSVDFGSVSSGDTKPVSGGDVYSAVSAKQDTISVDTGLTLTSNTIGVDYGSVASGNNKPVKGGDVYSAVSAKQDTISVDTGLTLNSNTIGVDYGSVSSGDNKPVKGGDVYTAVSGKSAVSWNQQITTGQQIATITIDGTTTNVFAPTGGGGGGGGNVDSVNGKQGTVILELGDMDDANFTSLGDNHVPIYDATDQEWQNAALSTVALSGAYNDLSGKPTLATVATSGSYSDLSNKPSIPTVTDTYSGTSSDAMSGKAVKSALQTLDGSVTGSPATSKTLSAFSETDGVVSATFSDISITKSQVSDFPAIPDALADLTTDVSISGTPTQGQALIVNSSGKWANANLPSGGHTMSPTPDASVDEAAVVSAVNDALTIDGGANDEVPSLFGMGMWANTDCIILMAQVDQGDDGLGEWNDDWEEEVTPQRSGWLWDESLYQVLEDGNGNRRYDIHIEPDFDVAEGEVVSLYSMRVDDDYTLNGVHGGCVAFKFNGEIQNAHAYVGVKLTHLRTKYKVVTPLT